MIGIYKITSPTGKIYIGQSCNLDKRYLDYVKTVNCKNQTRLYNSLKKYGFSEHIFEVIEECIVDDLNKRERYWQDFYNVLEEGLNCKLTAAEDKSGRLSQETVQKIGNANRGKKKPLRTQEHKQHLSNAAKQRKRSSLPESTKRKIGLTVSKKLTGRKLSEEHKEHMAQERRIRCFNKRGHLLAIDTVTGEVIYKFKNISDAKQVGFDLGSIGNSVKKGHRHRGYIWKYEKK